MRKVTVLLITACFFAGTGYPLYPREPINLFINTDPINAEVYINGESAGRTPLRLTGFEHEVIEVRVSKDGYMDGREEVRLGELRRELLFFSLSPLNVQITFHQKNQNIYFNDEKVGKTPITIDNLPAGVYRLEKREDGIAFSNESFRQLKRVTLLETFFTAGLLGLSVTGSVIYKDNERDVESRVLGISSALFGSLLGYNLLKLYKINLSHKMAISSVTAIEVESFRTESARDLFSSGMALIGREKWDEAITKFSFVLNLFPDSEVTAISVYEIGYCYYQLRNYPKAIEYFKKFVYDYPIHELFVYSVFYLIDLELNSGLAFQAMQDYSALKRIYLEDESGALYKKYYRLFTGLYNETGGTNSFMLEDFLDELNYFLSNNDDSSAYPEIFLMKGRLLYEYLDREEGLSILKDIRKNYSYDKKLIMELESILNG